VTDTARLALVVAVVLAILDWIAVAQRRKALEYISKPGVMLALIVVAISLTDVPDGPRWAFVVALAASMLGDIFLMLPADRFIAGVASFFLAHLAYIVGLRIGSSGALSFVLGAAVVAVYAAVIGLRIINAVREKEPGLTNAVAAYTAVISVMVASAIATRNVLAAVGAVVFMASDTLIAWNRFVQPLAWAPVTIMVTYHVGQAMLVGSLVRG
jgi:uncharacterized membrane protein YhhN